MFKITEMCRELPGCAQSVTRSWDERGTCKAALPLEVVPGGLVCPFLLSVLLLLSFLLIFGNIIHSNKASLEKSKPFWKCS